MDLQLLMSDVAGPTPVSALVTPPRTAVPEMGGATLAALGLGVAVLVLLTALALGRRRLLRSRHARLGGATPEDALLQAGLGRPVAPEPLGIESAMAITVLPAGEAAASTVELAEEDLELAGLLGPDHPMSAPGRHRTAVRPSMASAGGGGADLLAARLEPEDPSPRALGRPEDRNGEDRNGEDRDGEDRDGEDQDGEDQDDRDRDGEDQDGEDRDDHGAEPTGTTEGEHPMGGQSGTVEPVRARDFYGIDWHDEQWAGDDLTEAATAEEDDDGVSAWWDAPPVTASDGTPRDEVDEPAVDDMPVAIWWDAVADSELPIPLVSDFAAEPVAQAADTGHEESAPSGGFEAVRGVPSQRSADAAWTLPERLDAADSWADVARAVTEEGAAAADADSVALVVRSLTGPYVLSIHPDGDVWGPQTLAALIGAGAPIRQVVSGDPLADGATTALLAVPVAAAGAWVGALVARRCPARAFTGEDENRLDRMAELAGARLEALTRRELTGRARPDVDLVTGLASHHRLVEDLRQASVARDEHGMPLCLVVAEVDGLSRMRSELDDSAADEALTGIVDALMSLLRVGDVPYRFGEDTLAVLLPGTDTDEAAEMAERMVRAGDAVSDGVYAVSRPLRVHPVVTDVDGSAEEILDEVERALAEQRISARWAAG